MTLELTPLAVVHNDRIDLSDDYWGGMISDIVLDESIGEEALWGIEEFSHVEVIFYFHRVPDKKVSWKARRPRGNPDWPEVGILAQRKKSRPNRLGVTVARVVERKGRTLQVEGLDAVAGTPVLDIKPVMDEFLPKTKVVQPDWSRELMVDYWKDPQEKS